MQDVGKMRFGNLRRARASYSAYKHIKSRREFIPYDIPSGWQKPFVRDVASNTG